MRLLYSKESDSRLIGYAYARDLFVPHKGQSQIGYLFTSGGTTIS